MPTSSSSKSAAAPSFSSLLSRARPHVERELEKLLPPYTLFFSISDGKQRARVCHARGGDFASLWQSLASSVRKQLKNAQMPARWLRIDWVTHSQILTWRALQQRFEHTKRGYFRYGLALDEDWSLAFLEQELNGNAMLYGGNKIPHVVLNPHKFRAYADRRFGKNANLDFSDQALVTQLSTEGIYLDHQTPPQKLYGPGRNAGRRIIEELDEATSRHLINTSSRYLASQVLKNGRFEYGWHCCFDRPIGTYNTLRHASSIYAMTEAWEVTQDPELKQSIDRALAHLTKKLIQPARLPSGEQAAFLVEANNEIKLGGNAVCLLALVKYSELTGTTAYHTQLDQLAAGIQFMQDTETGKFAHVLRYPELSVKDEFRVIYYDGEATFGLMRLYGLTKNERWLNMVEKAFEYFIANNHWQAHDHWLSYCVNELTLYRPQARYYEFGIQNVNGYLDFVLERITTFPTLLELMMAAERMVTRLREQPEYSHLLAQLDLPKFYRALHTRAMYLLNGYYWPEYAMYFENPGKIIGSFYIRHHAFRVRIDDVEHYLSGFVAFRKYLLRGGLPETFSTALTDYPMAVKKRNRRATFAWGGDVNLGRRQHYRMEELGEEQVLGRLPALSSADLSVVNLECVVATTGEQGIDKGESAPYYYRARPEMLKLLCRAGIDAVTTANNHSGDYGCQALLEQGFWLNAIGIGHTGSGVNLEAALKPIIRAAGDLNIAIFSLDATQKHFAAGARQPGIAHLPIRSPQEWEALLRPRIAIARQRAHAVLVAVHWGDHRQQAPDQQQIDAGHSIIDAGADAVLGTGTHDLRGIEIYRHKPIIHDAGDLLFDAVRNDLKDSGIFRLELGQNGVEGVRYFPVGVGFGFSRQLTGDDAHRATERYRQRCLQLRSDLQLQEDGSGYLPLTPPRFSYFPIDPAPKTILKPELLNQFKRPPNPDWIAVEVPVDAQIEPQEFGPLHLLGIRYSPDLIEQRQLFFVETFWTLREEVTGNLRLDIRAVPIQQTTMPEWGKSMDHEPCDWQVPTSRWQPGVIYRDYYALRPPLFDQLRNIDLQLEIGIIGPETTIRPERIPGALIRVKIPSLMTTDLASPP
ncbi:CapA family protein [Microbulbifer bruguierae]|uniref:CapA family protein n=1 Tax=Microbulbifer bruguierae TaxID=3029061 RepID=A0ABY8NDK5_9GAMM|nr:CapA family protein [Microbulbifer bruguierae]WGL16535.1 CapA family protein [Microbulbifer bruguierae]